MKLDKFEAGMARITGENTLPKENFAGKKAGFPLLNWLRFALAVYIVLFHTLKNSPVLDDTWIEAALGLGNMATSIFFVLSGFLLTYVYVVQKNGRKVDGRSFLTARLSALYPLHVAGLILALIPMGYLFWVKGGVPVAVDVAGTTERMLSHAEVLIGFVSNLLLLNAWNPYYMSFNYPSWSLSALACYYLAFPAIAPKVYRLKSPAFALLLIGVIFLLPGVVADMLQRTDIVTDGILHRNPIIRFPLFLAGMVLCVLFARVGTAASPKVAGMLAGVLLATLAVGIVLQFNDSHLHVIRNGLYFPASLAAIWLCVVAKPGMSAGARKWGERLGAASLPLFLLHGPTYQLFVLAEKVVIGAILSPNWKLGSIVAAARDVDPPFLCYFLYLIGLIVLCVFVQERLVTPLQVRIKNYMAERRAPAIEAGESRTGTA